MAIRVIPIIPGVLAFSFKVDLDNRPFEFVFRFSSRSQLWHFDLKDDAGTTLLYKVPLHVRQFLLKQFQYDARLPQGNLAAINLISQDVNPTQDNLGIDVILVYEDALA